MATIAEIVRSIKQIQDAAKMAYGISDLDAQVAKATGQVTTINVEIARARAEFRSVDVALQSAHAHMLNREKFLASANASYAIAGRTLDASRSIMGAIEHIRVAPSVVNITANATKEWLAVIKASELAQFRPSLPLEAHFARLYELAAIAEVSLLRVRSDSIGSRLDLDGSAREQLTATHTAFGQEYRAFFDTVSTHESTIVEVSKSLTELPAAEFVHEAALIVSTSEAEVDDEAEKATREITDELAAETTDQLTSLVSGLNKDLAVLLQGARVAFDTRNPDYVRHFAVSLRELFTQVLHKLSPDALVEQWTKKPQHYHNNKPTRKARLLYITRDIGPIFGGFITADVDAVLEFVDAFQKGTHGVRPNFSDGEILDMRRRMEGLLRLLLTIGNAR
jgi:hypothetical protein